MTGENVTVQGEIDTTSGRPLQDPPWAKNDGETVFSTADNEPGDFSFDLLPDKLPLGDFSEMEKKVLATLYHNPNAEDAAELLDVSETSVGRAQQKASCFISPEEAPFPIPDEPTWTGTPAIRDAIEHPESRDFGLDLDGDNDTAEEQDTGDVQEEYPAYSSTVLEILGRYYKLGQSSEEIAEAMDDVEKEAQVNGSLVAKSKIPRSEWIVPDVGKAEPAEGNESESHEGLILANATNETVDLAACECKVPELYVDKTSFGPDDLQGLFCNCGHRFTAIYGSGE